MAQILISMEPIILVVHFVIAILLMVTILLQPGKGDIGAAFGAGGSQSVFGVRGAATFLSKVTTIAAVLFLMTSISLATVAKYEAKGAIDENAIDAQLNNLSTDAKGTPENTPLDKTEAKEETK